MDCDSCPRFLLSAVNPYVVAADAVIGTVHSSKWINQIEIDGTLFECPLIFETVIINWFGCIHSFQRHLSWPNDRIPTPVN